MSKRKWKIVLTACYPCQWQTVPCENSHWKNYNATCYFHRKWKEAKAFIEEKMKGKLDFEVSDSIPMEECETELDRVFFHLNCSILPLLEKKMAYWEVSEGEYRQILSVSWFDSKEEPGKNDLIVNLAPRLVPSSRRGDSKPNRLQEFGRDRMETIRSVFNRIEFLTNGRKIAIAPITGARIKATNGRENHD